ncbi:hypothetical protein NEOLEDRAFT_314936 [Neolentinus lepideus HHB14362 ss-1]|uniref:Uncharacterized protein n=1 Tax=Neolentinus lepideus HHB14362 ss-1 TaxID=1314782 RepID=A0A165VTR6_9AGAM|nr:hypothetical protein NEOLEDRAFT_314936 [Neolentinus lepideus HHB14362 ss-1]
MLQSQWSTRSSDNLEYRPISGICVSVCRRIVEKTNSRVGSWLDLGSTTSDCHRLIKRWIDCPHTASCEEDSSYKHDWRPGLASRLS